VLPPAIIRRWIACFLSRRRDKKTADRAEQSSRRKDREREDGAGEKKLCLVSRGSQPLLLFFFF
jgi:hypothetical protein